MAKGRMLNREVCISAKFDALSSDRARMFATWTIPWLDKNGVFHATPQIVRAHVTPLREDITAANEIPEKLYIRARQTGLRDFFSAPKDAP